MFQVIHLNLEKNSPSFGDQLAEAVQLTSDDTEAIATQKPDLIIRFFKQMKISMICKAIAPVLVIEYGKKWLFGNDD